MYAFKVRSGPESQHEQQWGGSEVRLQGAASSRARGASILTPLLRMRRRRHFDGCGSRSRQRHTCTPPRTGTHAARGPSVWVIRSPTLRPFSVWLLPCRPTICCQRAPSCCPCRLSRRSSPRYAWRRACFRSDERAHELASCYTRQSSPSTMHSCCFILVRPRSADPHLPSLTQRRRRRRWRRSVCGSGGRSAGAATEGGASAGRGN